MSIQQGLVWVVGVTLILTWSAGCQVHFDHINADLSDVEMRERLEERVRIGMLNSEVDVALREWGIDKDAWTDQCHYCDEWNIGGDHMTTVYVYPHGLSTTLTKGKNADFVYFVYSSVGPQPEGKLVAVARFGNASGTKQRDSRIIMP